MEALLFLDWYDGIVINRLQVGHSKFRVLPDLRRNWAIDPIEGSILP